MDLQRLKYFLEVARQKNFSKAALVCHVSQPSLSQQIKKLEGEVGGILFQRTRGKVSLSHLGENFLKHAQAILAEVHVAEEFVNRSQDVTQRTIRIGAIPTIGPYMIPEIFSCIRERHPHAQFELMEALTEHLIEALHTGEIDFALMSPPTRIDDECDYVHLLKDEFLLTLPRDHSLCGKKLIRMDTLRKESIILLENTHCLSAQTAVYCDELGLTTEVKVSSSQIDTLLGIVEKGFGLAFTPRLATKAHSHRRVEFRSVKVNPCFRDIRLMWLKRQILSRSQQTVIDLVKGLSFEG